MSSGSGKFHAATKFFDLSVRILAREAGQSIIHLAIRSEVTKHHHGFG
jgi:hypothetical protein